MMEQLLYEMAQWEGIKTRWSVDNLMKLALHVVV